ncbi:hypothetical protein BCR34DRAFT_490529, partial [Clohesyomyces aquaticus]
INITTTVPAGSIKKTFYYNRMFSYPPDAKTDAAWDSVYPRGLGFIHHPVLAPNQSGLAVFHQLHCLHGLRNQYYLAIEQSKNGSRSARNNDEHSDPGHVRHCFDLLRQSIMCAADTNVEPIKPNLGGITGWGHERRCRDFRSVFEWAGKWSYVEPVPTETM